MQTAIQELVSRGGIAICKSPDALNTFYDAGPLVEEVVSMLDMKNGFYAYDSALLVRPLRYGGAPLGLVEWNTPELWKANYIENLNDALCFAEDIFGCQYFVREHKVWAFDPETGGAAAVSGSLEGWADLVLADASFRTGFPLARAWQQTHGALPRGQRLLPKVPFICGGKYETDNLYPLDDVSGMKFRASIARQVHDLPDGAQIRFSTEP